MLLICQAAFEPLLGRELEGAGVTVAEQGPRLRAFVRRQVADLGEVDDIVQETFLELVSATRLVEPLLVLAREGEGLALVPPVVVRDEIESGVLVETHRITQILETFYAITPSRRFPNPLVAELVAGMGRPKIAGKT